jgi:transcriptional regulator with XRE-family HTH domain
MRLGELIAIARECKGWTLRELERRAGVSNAVLSQIETGKVKDPGFATVVRVCDALGISIERAAATSRPPLSALRARTALASKETG